MDRKRVHNAVAARNLPTVEILRDLNNRWSLTDTEHELQRKIDERMRKTAEDMIVKPSGFPLIVITGEKAEMIDSSNVREYIRDDKGDLCITLISYDTAAEAAAGIMALAMARGSARDEYAFYACIGELAESLVEDVRRHNGE